MTAKQAMIDLIANLADDSDWDEIMELVFLKARIQQAETEKALGQVYTTEEVLARVRHCNTKSPG